MKKFKTEISLCNSMTDYKGYKIKEIYQSADGRGNSDYFISGGKLPSSGEVRMKTTVKKIIQYLDTL